MYVTGCWGDTGLGEERPREGSSGRRWMYSGEVVMLVVAVTYGGAW